MFLSFSFHVLGKTVTNYENEGERISVVVIDAGHGGKDLGASVGNIHEKDIALTLALQLGELIKTSYPEIKIVYTRNKDVFIPLYERARIANRNKANLFISIHVNSAEQTNAQGTETFVLGQHRTKENLEVAKKENSVILLEDDYNTTYEGFDPNSPESYIMFELIQNEYLEQSVMFASSIQNQFREKAKRIDRSVKQSGFLVLRQIAMPGVLIEVGFISNPKERSFMVSKEGKAELATSIFNAFKDYKKEIENKSSFSIRSESPNQTTLKKDSDNLVNNDVKKQEKANTSNILFSVQIASSRKKQETTPSNFKGEKNIFRRDDGKISRYFSGEFVNYNDAEKEKKRISKKFPEAFVVAFKNGELISVKKALEIVN